jgi:ubiquinone/menaquinone biosynthesis C-methylase UbiE
MNPAQIWNGYMKSYDFLTQIDGYTQNILDVADAAEVKRGTRVLDAGSGTGNLSLLLKSRGAEVTACDFCSNALALHRAKDPSAKLVQASLEELLPFEVCEFDVVCCLSVLFALSRKGCNQALQEFRRVLVDGGRLVLTIPSSEARWNRLVGMHWKAVTRRHGWIGGFPRAMRDVPSLAKVLYYNKKLKELPDWQGWHRFTEEELIQLVIGAGFRNVIARRTYGGVFFMITASR